MSKYLTYVDYTCPKRSRRKQKLICSHPLFNSRRLPIKNSAVTKHPFPYEHQLNPNSETNQF